MKPIDTPRPATDTPAKAGPDDATPRLRKPYEPPSFAREQLFETTALACGKINPVSGQCRAFRKNS